MINDKDQSHLYEQWCCSLVIDKIVEYYKLHDNEGMVIYKKQDIDSSGDKGDDEMLS